MLKKPASQLTHILAGVSLVGAIFTMIYGNYLASISLSLIHAGLQISAIGREDI